MNKAKAFIKQYRHLASSIGSTIDIYPKSRIHELVKCHDDNKRLGQHFVIVGHRIRDAAERFGRDNALEFKPDIHIADDGKTAHLAHRSRAR